jgi:hypothetical protein
LDELGWPQFQWTALPYYFPMPALIEKYAASGNPEDALNTNTRLIIENSMLPEVIYGCCCRPILLERISN